MPWIDRYRVRVFENVDPKEWRKYWHMILGELWVSALSRLLIGIQRYGHGGAVLISDRADGLTAKYTLSYPRLTDSLIRLGVHHLNTQFYADRVIDDYVTQNIHIPPMAYLNESVESMQLKDTKDELKGCIRFLTSLSRVDGLLWIDPNLELKAFGVEIAEQQDPTEVSIAHHTDGCETTKITISRYGMRHRSMVRYCGFNPNAVGFVVSQDGGLKAITKIDDSVVIWDKVRIHSLLTPRSPDRRRNGRL